MATKRIESPQLAKTILSTEEAHELFERKARALLGISGREFLHRWDTGQYRNLPDTTETRNIMRVAALLPFGRR